MKVGDTIRVLARGEFRDQVGSVVSTKEGKKIHYIGVRLPDHPWQKKQPHAVWWFHDRELEQVK